MSTKSENVLGGSKPRQFSRDHLGKHRFSEYDSRHPLPPKHPGVHRSPDVKPKQVAFWDTDSTGTQSSEDIRSPSSRNSWSCGSDSKDQFSVSQKFPAIPRSPRTPRPDNSDPDRCSQSSSSSASCESGFKDGVHARTKFPGIHRSSKTKQRVSWEIDLINDVKSALNDLGIDLASPRSSCGEFDSTEVFVRGELTAMGRSPEFETIQPSRNSDNCESSAKEVALAPPSSSKNHLLLEYDHKRPILRESDRRTLDDDDVRKIVDGILKELRPPQESISCSSSCSGCCSSCCYDGCSNFGAWTPRPSTPAVDIPKIRPKPAFLARIHGNPPRNGSPMDLPCSCSQITVFKNPINPPAPVLSPSSWFTNSFCSQCLSPFDKDSLDSKISIDSLNHQSIFSLDSLNSLTDPDSLEYSKTNVSIDSLDSLDSCCNDSLSESKDSGFFSCSLPVVC